MGESSSSRVEADAAVDFDAVADALRADAAWLTNQIIDDVVGHVPSYGDVARTSLSTSLLRHIDTAARALSGGRAPDEVRDVSAAADRARAGIPIEHVLLAIRMAFQTLREFVMGAAPVSGLDSAMQLEAVRILWEVNDLVSREYAVAHREADLHMARVAETHRVEFVRHLLRDGMSSPDMALHATSFGLPSSASYRAFRAPPCHDQAADGVLQSILRWGSTHRLQPIGAIVDGDAVGVMVGNQVPEQGPTLGIGPAVALDRVPESFRLAGQLIEVGVGFGRTGPQTLESLSLLMAVASERVVGDGLVQSRLQPLLSRGEFGQELLTTLDAFLTAGMSTSRAAEMLVIHPNTMRYRLNQVKLLTGLDLETGQQLCEVWWALRRQEWVQRSSDHGARTV
jgi:hypothetical protein